MHFAFATTLSGLPWGASEELWSRTAGELLDRGHRVTLLGGAGKAIAARGPAGPDLLARGARWRRLWGGLRADLVLLSIAYFPADLVAARLLATLGIPYALLVHCASAGDWITAARLDGDRRAFFGARRTFFVSAENQRIVERQLGRPLPRATVVDNPLAVRPSSPLPWPTGPVHLACVGRLHCRSKGQDLIVEVLGRNTWRHRDLRVTFWGRDQGNARQLQALAAHLGVDSRVQLAGHTSRPEEIWRRCHGLLLASRYEGMPMVTAEAMLCGRVPIVTECGRNGQWVDDTVTGFLASAATPDLLDDALERAWRSRARWPEIGRRAARRLRAVYDPEPVATFADSLTGLAAPRQGRGPGSVP